jgi:hypothetical protein
MKTVRIVLCSTEAGEKFYSGRFENYCKSVYQDPQGSKTLSSDPDPTFQVSDQDPKKPIKTPQKMSTLIISIIRYR